MAREWRTVSEEEAKEHPLYGVKNWLFVFALAVLLGPLISLSRLNAEAYRQGLSISQMLNLDASFKAWMTFGLVAEASTAILILGLMFTKNAKFRAAASIMLISVFPLFAVLGVVVDAPGSAEAAGLGIFPWAISCLVWVTYLQRSRRVRVTFEHAILATEAGPPAAPVLASDLSALPVPHLEDGGAHTTPSQAAAAMPSAQPSTAAHFETAQEPPARAAVPASVAAGDDDEELWAQALEELNGAARKPGVWAKCFAQASGNEPAAQAQYLSERVRQLAQERQEVRRAASEQQAERQRSDEHARQLLVQRASEARASFLSGQKLSAVDVEFLVGATGFDGSLVALTDRARGDSLLHWAARHNLKAAAIALIAKGANAGARNGDGRTPIDLCTDDDLANTLRNSAQRI